MTSRYGVLMKRHRNKVARHDDARSAPASIAYAHARYRHYYMLPAAHRRNHQSPLIRITHASSTSMHYRLIASAYQSKQLIAINHYMSSRVVTI